MATTKTIKKSAEKIIEDITYSSSHQSISRRVIYEYKNLKIKHLFLLLSTKTAMFTIA